MKLAATELVGASVQILSEGGENNLHYHSGEDGFWMVLQGRVKFYGPDGPIGEYGPHEGLIMPHNARYWFEAVTSAGELQILHVAGRRPTNNRRINIGERTKRGVWIDPSGDDAATR
jgi:mannose-6-phosphate isomerase-like protein (cupin superfamily)